MTALLAWLCSLGVSFSRLSKYLSENATLAISGSRFQFIHGINQFFNRSAEPPSIGFQVRSGRHLILNVLKQQSDLCISKHQLGLAHHLVQLAGNHSLSHQRLVRPIYLMSFQLYAKLILKILKPDRSLPLLFRLVILGRGLTPGLTPLKAGSYAAVLGVWSPGVKHWQELEEIDGTP